MKLVNFYFPHGGCTKEALESMTLIRLTKKFLFVLEP